jgi:hypothetical protein
MKQKNAFNLALKDNLLNGLTTSNGCLLVLLNAFETIIPN